MIFDIIMLILISIGLIILINIISDVVYYYYRIDDMNLYVNNVSFNEFMQCYNTAPDKCILCKYYPIVSSYIIQFSYRDFCKYRKFYNNIESNKNDQRILNENTRFRNEILNKEDESNK